MNVKIGLFLFVLLSLGSCKREKIAFEGVKNLKNAQWTYADSLFFDFNIPDTNKVYDIRLRVTHVPNFETQNLYAQIHTLFPSSKRLSQLISLELADNFGKWQGACSDKSCALEINIQENAYFNEVGAYRIVLEQAMRRDSVGALEKLGVVLVEKNVNRADLKKSVKK
jgi:gliding motility-associated lipoprotein GldH